MLLTKHEWLANDASKESEKRDRELEYLRSIPDSATHVELVAHYHYLTMRYEEMLRYKQSVKIKLKIVFLVSLSLIGVFLATL